MRWIVTRRPSSSRVPILTFLMFESWFLVPLPKGPLEKCWDSESRGA